MGTDAVDGERTLEERVERLEARIIRLEGQLGPARGDPLAKADAQLPTAAVASSPGSGAALSIPPAPSRPDVQDRVSVPAIHAAAPLFVDTAADPAHSATATAALTTSGSAPLTAPVSRQSREVAGASWLDELLKSVHIPTPDLSGSFNDIEERLAGRALAVVGGIAIILGAIFFLSLAFSRGWIGPELRVVIGLAAGAASLAGGAAFMERGNRLLGHVLTPVGLAIITISLVAATSLYRLIPAELGLVIALASAIGTAVIAVRANSQVVAGFGLVSVLLAPPLMGASPDLQTLLFVAVVLVGTTGIALWRTWSWLPPVAFALSAPQLASWIAGGPEPALGLTAIGLYWLLNLVAAGGEAVRRRRDDLSASSPSLLLANAAFLVWAGFALLDGDLVKYRGFFLVLVALAHLGIGGYIVVRDGERNLFGLLAIGTGIAALTMAAPIGLGAPAVPVAWSAEAVALAWLAARRGHPYSALVSGVLYVLAGAATVSRFVGAAPPASGVAFANADGASLAFFLGAAAAGVWLTRDRSLRSSLASFGLVVASVCVIQVLVPASATIGLTLLMVVGVATWRGLPLLPSRPIVWQVDGLIPQAFRSVGDWRRPMDLSLPIASWYLAVAATTFLVVVYGPSIGGQATAVPFVNPAGAALAVYLVGLLAIAAIGGRSWWREPLGAVGLLMIAWACAAEFAGVSLVAAWASLMVLGFGLWRGLRGLPQEAPRPLPMIVGTSDQLLPLAAFLAGGLAALQVIIVELPLAEFGRVLPPTVPFTDSGAVAGLILVVATLAVGYLVPSAAARRTAIVVAIGVVAYTIPYEVYAWGVSVLWVALGGLALWLIRPDPSGRQGYLVAAISLIVGAAYVAVVIVAPPTRLVVGATAIAPIVILQSVIALGAVIDGLIAIARTGRSAIWARWAWIAAGVMLVYLLSILAVDLVASQVGGHVATAELRTQGQVALSVLWAVLGLSAFVAGLRLRIDDLRHGGLALLALATAKVFLFDLAALDVAYRVISLVALGLLLLMSAWVWQRLRPKAPAETVRVGD